MRRILSAVAWLTAAMAATNAMANKLYTLSQLEQGITHACAGTPNANLPIADVVSRAMDWIADYTTWHWLEKPISINITQQSLGAGTVARASWAFNPYNNAAVTGPSAWDGGSGNGSPIYRDTNGVAWVYYPNHGLQSGLYVSLINVTSAATDGSSFNGSYEIQTPDGNTFTYANPGTTGSNAPQDLNPQSISPNGYGQWIGGQVTLPSDFSSMKTLAAPNLSLRVVAPVTLGQLMERRQYSLGSTLECYYAVSYLPQASVTTEPAPTMHLFPVPTFAQQNYLQGFYIRRLPQLVNSTDVPDVPSNFQTLVYHACRAFAVSNEEDRAGEDWRITNMLVTQLSEHDAVNQEPQGYMRKTVTSDWMPSGNYFGYRPIAR